MFTMSARVLACDAVRTRISTSTNRYTGANVCMAIAVSAASIFGCGGGLPSPSVVEKLRLLAVHTPTPEVLSVAPTGMPADGITLTAWWDDGSPRAGRDVFFVWRLCAEGVDREPRSCFRAERGINLATQVARNGGTQSFTIPPENLRFEPVGSDVGLTTYFVMVAMCPDAAPVLDSSAGQFVCPSEASLANELREGVQAVRRVIVRSAEPLNHNPSILRVKLADTFDAGSEVIDAPMCPVFSDGTPNCTGVAITVFAGGPVERRLDGTPETLLASFFVTAGSVDRPRSLPAEGYPLGMDGALSVLWYPPATAGMHKVWVVLRDGHGGDDERMFTVRVR